MATIKVSDSSGVKYLQCFDTLDNVPYFEDDEIIDDTPEDKNPFE